MKRKWSWWPDCCREGGMITDDETAAHIAAPTWYASAPEVTAKHAHLLAAAPELLEALESALKTAEFERHPSRPWHQLAKDAIAHAKAKGQGGE